jgi:hypothetical protein
MTKLFHCASSNDQHYIIEPIPLLCGHSICKKCIPINCNNYQIKCKLCGQFNKIEFDDLEITFLSKKANINQLFQEIEERMIKSVQDLKGELKILKKEKFINFK